MRQKAKPLLTAVGMFTVALLVFVGNAAKGPAQQTQQGEILLRTFPAGHERKFYWDILRQRGYRVIEEKVNTAGQLTLEAAKADHAIVLIVLFDPEIGRSTGVVAHPLEEQSRLGVSARAVN
jgi:hypothetical protein